MPDIETISRQANPGEHGYAENIALGVVAEKMEVAPGYRRLKRGAGTSIDAIAEGNCAGSSSSSSCDRNSTGS